MRSRFRTARLASMVESGISWECHLRGALLLVRSLLISGATFGENSINAAFGFAPAAGFVVIVDSGWQGDGCASRGVSWSSSVQEFARAKQEVHTVR